MMCILNARRAECSQRLGPSEIWGQSGCGRPVRRAALDFALHRAQYQAQGSDSRFLSRADVSPRDELRENLTLALDELLSNSLEHGCATEPKRGVELSVVRTPRLICFHLRDSGPGFSLDQVPHAALGNPPGSPLDHASLRSRLGMRPGGFGILLVKQIADELLYNEHGNEVFFVKYLDPAAAQ